jgi:uncharacterized protein YgiM (DUF1202 family)
MADQQIPSQWQLSDSGQSQDKWKLQEGDQALPAHLQLQPGVGPVATTWQPIDYRTPKQRPQRGGMVLGTLVVLALIAVAAYLTWFYMNQGETDVASGTDATAQSGAPAGEPTVDIVETQAASTTEPTATVPPEPTATSTPEPTPTAAPLLVELREVTVNSQYGVNVRREPSAGAELVKLVENALTFLVIGGPTTDAEGNEWWQIAIDPATQGWASGEFLTLASRQVTTEELADRLRAVGIEPTPTPEPVAPAATVLTPTAIITGAVTPTGVITTPVESPGSTPISVTAIISAVAGLNAREAPSSTATVVTLLANATNAAVVDVSDDLQWLQLLLPDGRLGWVAAQFATVTGDLNALASQPAVDVTAQLTATAPITNTSVLTGAPSITTTVPITPTIVTTGTATVTFVTGVNARPAPASDAAALQVLPWNSQFPAIGRSSDSQWVLVVLNDGTTAWVAASAVGVTPEIAALPVAQ